MDPFKHINSKVAKQAAISMDERQFARLSKRCYEASCPIEPCILVTQSQFQESRYCSCLLHYIAQREASAALEGGQVTVFDQERLRVQTPQVNELWKEIVADVVLDMFALQKEEEEKLRKDPLSILSLNRPSQAKSVAQIHGAGAAERALDSDSNSNKKRKAPSGAAKNNAKASDEVLDPYRRINHRHDNLLGSSMAEEYTEAEKIARNARLEKEEKEADGEPCLACGSKWTATRLVELVENSRSETWGFKDAPVQFRTECFKCQHIHSFTEAN